MNFIIVWLLYIIIIFYNLIDATQTMMLMDLGVGEANPVMRYFIQMTGTPYTIFIVKLLPLILLGIGLNLYQKTLQGIYIKNDIKP